MEAGVSYVSQMKSIWLSAQAATQSIQPVPLPGLRYHSSGPVKVTTGLGLPLCRGFAHASGGWIAIRDCQDDAFTHLWCVMMSRPSAAAHSSYCSEGGLDGSVGASAYVASPNSNAASGSKLRVHPVPEPSPHGPSRAPPTSPLHSHSPLRLSK